VREARHAHALKQPSACAGVAGAEVAPGEELLDEEAAEEHIVARSSAPVRGRGTGEGPPD
jgi:hypothetical protein